MKNQGPSGEPWMCVAWTAIDMRCFSSGSWSKSRSVVGASAFDDVFQRVLVDARPQVEEQHRNLCVREELRPDVALQQVLRDRVVVGEVAVVHQRLVQTDERVRAARMPDAALRRVALVGDPDVRAQVLQPVVLDDLLGVADDLEYHQVSPVRQHERPLLAERRVEAVVQANAVS